MWSRSSVAVHTVGRGTWFWWAGARTRGGRRGKERGAQRSSDWRRGAAGSPDPDLGGMRSLATTGAPVDPSHRRRPCAVQRVRRGLRGGRHLVHDPRSRSRSGRWLAWSWREWCWRSRWWRFRRARGNPIRHGASNHGEHDFAVDRARRGATRSWRIVRDCSTALWRRRTRQHRSGDLDGESDEPHPAARPGTCVGSRFSSAASRGHGNGSFRGSSGRHARRESRPAFYGRPRRGRDHHRHAESPTLAAHDGAGAGE